MNKYYMEQSYKIYQSDHDNYHWEISEDSDGLQNIEFKYVEYYEDEDGLNTHEKSISVPIEIVDYLIESLNNLKLKIGKDPK